MHQGRAIGGPRDGIKLTADVFWDGKVKKPTTGYGGFTGYHLGHYKWVMDKGWVWQTKDENTSFCTSIHRWEKGPVTLFGQRCFCGEKIFHREKRETPQRKR